MFKWIIRDRLLGKKWKPAYMHSTTPVHEKELVEVAATIPTKKEAKKNKAKKVAGELSTKVLAVVVESTIGAANLHGGLEEEEDNIYLWKCLLHASPHVLDDHHVTFERFQTLSDVIADGLENGKIYPWTALMRLQAPKFFSDMIESLLGTVFLDSEGNLDRTQDVMRAIGVLPLLERIVKDDVNVLHPVSRLLVWASKQGRKVKYTFPEEKKNISCVIELYQGEGRGVRVLEEVRVTDRNRGKVTKLEVKFAAAEKAIKPIHV